MIFSSLEPKLSSETLLAVEELKFIKSTPVQAATIPLFLKNKDVLVEATTGSGKTLAFAIPVFEILTRNNIVFKTYEIGALIIAPTRELASQIYDVFNHFSTFHSSIKCSLYMGGNDIKDNINSFNENGSNIVIGTPGRVLDIYKRCPLFRFNKLEVLILDEADTLLDMGFKESINQILALLPKQRRTGLFSATQTKELKDLVRAGMRNPVSIMVRVASSSSNSNTDGNTNNNNNNSQNTTSNTSSALSSAVPSTLSNFYSICSYENRPAAIVKFIKEHLHCKIIVFLATCACVDYYSMIFNSLRQQANYFPKDFTILGFHGKMIQKRRNVLYKRFVNVSAGGLMFSTDVAARGIDIPDVDWIIQMTAPKDPAFFVHRVGRTARAGKSGGALLYVTQAEQAYINLLRGRGVAMTRTSVSSENDDDEYEEETNDNDNDVGVHNRGSGGSGGSGGSEVMPYVSQDGHEGQQHDEEEEDEESDDDDDDEDEEEEDEEDEEEVKQAATTAVTASSSSHTTHLTPTPTHTNYSSTNANTSTTDFKSFSQKILLEMKQFAISDRAVLEAGSTAFMAFLRAYQEHLCSYIFRLNDLDIGSVARGYALLRLPKIPETRGLRGKLIQFETSEVDTSKIKYKHKEKESARIRKKEKLLNESIIASVTAAGGAGADSATGTTTGTGAVTDNKKKWIPADEYQPPEEEKRVRHKKRTKQQVLMEEWEELAAETSNFKKYKKGKLSTVVYDKLLLSDRQQSSQSMTSSDNQDNDDNDNDNDIHADTHASSNDDNNNDDDDDNDDNDGSHNNSDDESDDKPTNTSYHSKFKFIDEDDTHPVSSTTAVTATGSGGGRTRTTLDTKNAKKSKQPIDEKTSKIVDFWSSKSTKLLKQNKKRSSAISTGTHTTSGSGGGNDGIEKGYTKPKTYTKSALSLLSSRLRGVTKDRLPTANDSNSNNSNNNSTSNSSSRLSMNTPSFYDKRKKFKSLETISDSLSSKTKVKINNKMMQKSSHKRKFSAGEGSTTGAGGSSGSGGAGKGGKGRGSSGSRGKSGSGGKNQHGSSSKRKK